MFIQAQISCNPGSSIYLTNNQSVFIDRLTGINDYNYNELTNKQFNIYFSHGYYSAWSCANFGGATTLSYNNIPFLNLAWGSAGACLTGRFDGTKSFSFNWLRKGGMAYWGAQTIISESLAGLGIYKPFDVFRANSDIDLGHLAHDICLTGCYSFAMYGDPTLSIVYRGGANELPYSSPNAGSVSGMRVYEIDINVGGIVYLSCGGGDKDGSVVNYEWDFDNDGVYDWGTTNIGEEVTHIYNTTGTFKPRCRVTDNNGGQAISFVIINVN